MRILHKDIIFMTIKQIFIYVMHPLHFFFFFFCGFHYILIIIQYSIFFNIVQQKNTVVQFKFKSAQIKGNSN